MTKLTPTFCTCGQWNNSISERFDMKHGYRSHPLYTKWDHMIGRCYRKSHQSFKNYGGRGITVCDEWRNSPISFIEWAISSGWEYGLELDRKNNSKTYSPSTCRFLTPTENRRTSRLIRNNNTVGFCGVFKNKKKFSARVCRDRELFNLGTYEKAKVAAIVRDSFIVSEELSHPLNFPELFFNGPM